MPQVLDDPIFQALRQEFAELQPGAPIPSVRQLMARFRVSQLIIDRVFERLGQEFQIESQVGRGRFLVGRREGDATPDTPVIHLYLSNVRSNFQLSLRDAVQARAEASGMTMVEHAYSWRQMPRQYASGPTCAGIFVVPPSIMTAQDVSALESAMAPVVLLDRVPLGLRLHGIASDNVLGGGMAADHLISQGLNRLAIISSEPELNPNVGARIRGFQRQCRLAGLDLPPVLGGHTPSGGNPPDFAYTTMRNLLDAGPLPYDGIFADSAATAMGLIQACRERQVRIPQDLALIAFDDSPESRYMNPTITVLRQDVEAWAEIAVRIITESPQPGAVESPCHEQVPPALLMRESSKLAPLEALA